MPTNLRKTKIVATLGPASESPEMIRKLIQAGVNVFRLNFSHASYDEQGARIKNIRKIEKELGATVAIFQDLQGPKIRVGVLPEAGVQLIEGKKVSFFGGTEYDGKNIPIPVKEVIKEIAVGERLLFGDGDLKIEVTKKVPNGFEAKVIYGGTLFSKKGLIAEGRTFSLSALTKKDYGDIDYLYESGHNKNVDFIAFSFVKSAADVKMLRTYLKKKHGDEKMKIIVKFETAEAVANLDAIVEATDVIMVARGDLGMEMPFEEMPLIQKHLVEKCITLGKQVIVATNMLEHMVKNPFPTRAEVTDVATAVFQRASAIMLSAETAAGKYPTICVETMDKIARNIEAEQSESIFKVEGADNLSQEMTRSAAYTARHLKADAIIVFTKSGTTASLISKCRPTVPVFAFAEDLQLVRRLALNWGTFPKHIKFSENPEHTTTVALEHLKKEKCVKKGHRVVVVSDVLMGSRRIESALQVITVD